MNRKASILVLDREITRINYFDLNFKSKVLNYKVTKNIYEFQEALVSRKWDFIFIEHDLASNVLASNDPSSGYNALPMISENYAFKDEANIFVHTNNPQGSKNMQEFAYVNNMKITFVPYGSSAFKAEIVKVAKFLDETQY